MVNSSDFQKAVDSINKSSNVLITTHTKPDGDACGSAAAMYETLTRLGKKCKLLFPSPVPAWYEFLFTEKPQVIADDTAAEKPKLEGAGEVDLIVVVDTNTYKQLPGIETFLKDNDKPTLVIDHHATGQSIGDVELTDSSAAAAGLIVLDLLKFADWPVTKKIANALFVAVATDTGWFHFSNTNSRVYEACAELITAGASPTSLYRQLYQNFSQERFRLMVSMLSTIEFFLNGRYAAQQLTQKDFEHTGAGHEDTENLIDQCQRVSSVEAAALFVELKDGRIRCSLRSRNTIDVCKIAQQFGGGGHKMAAGTYLNGPLEEAKKQVFEAFKEQFEQLDGK
ncbi:MAG: bifunctional oligoribonuclease/PAP phosphatase NrnA [Sedimentisphaerales bacterium]|nr:bifunctional oligoribonuclease/PAP phosphatase NrnA [Sedimentisphaerales bacterium]